MIWLDEGGMREHDGLTCMPPWRSGGVRGGGAISSNSECWIIIMTTYPLGEVTSSLPALPARLKSRCCIPASCAALRDTVPARRTNDAQPLIMKVALKMILEL